MLRYALLCYAAVLYVFFMLTMYVRCLGKYITKHREVLYVKTTNSTHPIIHTHTYKTPPNYNNPNPLFSFPISTSSLPNRHSSQTAKE
jgi:hypothetical protein